MRNERASRIKNTRLHHAHEARYVGTMPDSLVRRTERIVDDLWVDILACISDCRVSNKCRLPEYPPPAKPNYPQYAEISREIFAAGAKNERMAAAGRAGAKHKQKPKQ